VLQSEVAAPSTRMFAFVTGSAGLVAIALLMLVMTPGRSGQPLVVSATTSPTATLAPTGSTTRIEEVRGFGRTAFTPSRALATPIGQGDHAIVLRAALPDPLAAEIDVELPSGHETAATVIAHQGAVVVVELAVSAPGHAVADRRPHDREIVTVMSSPPVTVAFADVHSLDVADGTAVLDSDGELVALCEDDDHDTAGTRLVEITPDVEATSAVP
jgi:hypothetical protein